MLFRFCSNMWVYCGTVYVEELDSFYFAFMKTIFMSLNDRDEIYYFFSITVCTISDPVQVSVFLTKYVPTYQSVKLCLIQQRTRKSNISTRSIPMNTSQLVNLSVKSIRFPFCTYDGLKPLREGWAGFTSQPPHGCQLTKP